MGELGGKILKLSCDAVFYTSSHMLTSLNWTHSVHGFYDMKNLIELLPKWCHSLTVLYRIVCCQYLEFLVTLNIFYYSNSFYKWILLISKSFSKSQGMSHPFSKKTCNIKSWPLTWCIITQQCFLNTIHNCYSSDLVWCNGVD